MIVCSTIDEFFSLSLEKKVAYIQYIIETDGCYTERTQSYHFLSEATAEAIILIGNLKNTQLFTEYGIQVVFEPDKRMLHREGNYLHAFIKYAAHFVTNREYQHDLPVIYYSRPKHEHLHKLLPALLQPDRILRKRADKTSTAHFKYFADEPKNNVLVVFTENINDDGSRFRLQPIAFMPDKKAIWIDKKISGDNSEYLELSPEEIFQQYSNPD